MIDGVEILNQITLYHTSWICDWEPAFFLLGLLAICGMLVADDNAVLGLSSAAVLVGCLIMFMLTLTDSIPDKSKPYQQYQVKISETVNFAEFDSKYEVVSQEGKIYTIIERKNEND